mmetsp:Transcript_103574/g.259749  ORF Transcript_103574/g.259749 Transcript_103574/m.259749 type:complete len:250 (+) Transcript_103574:1468-2217(+)
MQVLAPEGLEQVFYVLGSRLALFVSWLALFRSECNIAQQLQDHHVAVAIHRHFLDVLLQDCEQMAALLVGTPFQACLHHPRPNVLGTIFGQCVRALLQQLQDLANDKVALAVPGVVDEFTVQLRHLLPALLLRAQWLFSLLPGLLLAALGAAGAALQAALLAGRLGVGCCCRLARALADALPAAALAEARLHAALLLLAGLLPSACAFTASSRPLAFLIFLLYRSPSPCLSSGLAGTRAPRCFLGHRER